MVTLSLNSRSALMSMPMLPDILPIDNISDKTRSSPALLMVNTMSALHVGICSPQTLHVPFWLNLCSSRMPLRHVTLRGQYSHTESMRAVAIQLPCLLWLTFMRWFLLFGVTVTKLYLPQTTHLDVLMADIPHKGSLAGSSWLKR